MIGRLFKSIIGRNAPLASLMLPTGLSSMPPQTIIRPSRSSMLRIMPAFEKQRTIAPSRAFSTHAYEQFGSSKHWVPSEKLIDDQIAQVLARFNLAPQIAIHRYQGKPQSRLTAITPLSQHRDRHYCQVHRLPLFQTYHSLPNMENGVDIQQDPDLINRCLVLTHKHDDIILGAVYFTIDLQSRYCYLHLIQIDSTLQNKNLGKLLTHCVVNIALLYYCSMVGLTSKESAIHFYEQMGFQPKADGRQNQYVLDFIHWPDETRDKYIASFNSVSPGGQIESLLEQVKLLYPTASMPSQQAIDQFVNRAKIDVSLRNRFKN